MGWSSKYPGVHHKDQPLTWENRAPKKMTGSNVLSLGDGSGFSNF